MKTYRDGLTTTKPHFFMLSKGSNSGKPLETPCPNCFMITTATMEERNFYFWLAYGLWQAQGFYPHLIGSAISFLRIGDAKTVLLEAAEKAIKDRSKYLKSLALLQDFDKKGKILENQVRLIKQIKKAIMFQILLE